MAGVKKIPKPVYNKRFEDVPFIRKTQKLPACTTRRQHENQAGILTYSLFRQPSHPNYGQWRLVGSSLQHSRPGNANAFTNESGKAISKVRVYSGGPVPDSHGIPCLRLGRHLIQYIPIYAKKGRRGQQKK
jgi:hypothetical protein